VRATTWIAYAQRKKSPRRLRMYAILKKTGGNPDCEKFVRQDKT